MSRPPRLNSLRSALALLSARKAHWEIEDVRPDAMIRRWVVGELCSSKVFYTMVSGPNLAGFLAMGRVGRCGPVRLNALQALDFVMCCVMFRTHGHT